MRLSRAADGSHEPDMMLAFQSKHGHGQQSSPERPTEPHIIGSHGQHNSSERPSEPDIWLIRSEPGQHNSAERASAAAILDLDFAQSELGAYQYSSLADYFIEGYLHP